MFKLYSTEDMEQIFKYFMEAFRISFHGGRGTAEFDALIRQGWALKEDPGGIVRRFLAETTLYLNAAQTTGAVCSAGERGLVRPDGARDLQGSNPRRRAHKGAYLVCVHG